MEFLHKSSGTVVSTSGILNGQDDGWSEVSIHSYIVDPFETSNDLMLVIFSIFPCFKSGGHRRQHKESDVL